VQTLLPQEGIRLVHATGNRGNLKLALVWVAALGTLTLAVQIAVWILRSTEFATCTPAVDPVDVNVNMLLAIGFALIWAMPPAIWTLNALRLSRRPLPDVDGGRARGLVFAALVIAMHWLSFGTAMTLQVVQAALPEDICTASPLLRGATILTMGLFLPMVCAALYALVVGRAIRRSIERR
jgi:hypothetical protein